jgi:hypothetical protein
MSTNASARWMEPSERTKPNAAYIRLPSKTNVVMPATEEPCAKEETHTKRELRATKNTVPACANLLRNKGYLLSGAP